MFEDVARNLVAPKARGMKTVLVVAKAGQADHRVAEDRDAPLSPAADFVTDDLARFIERVNVTVTGR